MANKYLNDTGLSYFFNRLKTVFVEQESGKGLSTNDYTTEDKSKLSGITSGAEVNAIDTIKVNGTTQTITSKSVNIAVPTKTSDITNDSGFITTGDIPEGAAASTTVPKMDGTATTGTELAFARGDHVHPKDTTKADLASPDFTGTPTAPTASAGTNTTQIATTAFVKTAVDNAVAGITQFDFQVVTSLPSTGTKGVIYLVAHSHGTGDAYDEYIWTGSAFEKIGNTDIDLTDYMKKADMVAITTTEIDTLFA